MGNYIEISGDKPFGKAVNTNMFAPLSNPALMQQNEIDQVSAILNKAGNRSARRSAEKALRKSSNIKEYYAKDAQRQIRERTMENGDNDLVWLICTLADTLYEDYHWKESPDNDHGQITAFIERFVKRMNRYASEGYSTKQLVDMIEEKTGICIVPDQSWRKNL